MREIHLSGWRRIFRQKSFLSDIAEGVISGLGIQGYELALSTAINKFK